MEITNLFIVGNGFDLAHGLKTKYMDFREWLVSLVDEIDFEELGNILIAEVRNTAKRQAERMRLIDFAFEKLSVDEIVQRVAIIEQLEADFIQIENWAGFDIGDFNEIKLTSPFTRELIDVVKPDDVPFSRNYFLNNYTEFRQVFTEYSDKLFGDEYFNQASKTDVWDLSDLELPVSIMLMIKILDETAGDNWWNFEQSLGEVAIDEFIEWLFPRKDKFDANELLQLREVIFTSFCKSKYLFNVWACDIEITSAIVKPDFSTLIRCEDFFFSTNYTRTLEDVYGVKNVCHIHGTAKRIKDDFEIDDILVVGHGYDVVELQFGQKGGPDVKSISNNLLKKPVGRCIANHINFFNSLDNINAVFSFGFSFSDVDMPYIVRICESIGDTSKIIWYFNDFNFQEHEEMKRKLKKAGFNGQFDTFHIG